MSPLVRNRRQFLRFLAASPLLTQASPQSPLVLNSAADALSVKDFEEAARKALRPAHWGFMSGGVDDDATVKANLEGFHHYQLKPRRLVDVSKIDVRAEMFGTVWDSPVFLCPIGLQKIYHPDGELPVARAARAKKTLQMLATGSSNKLEDVTKALGAPPWFQLYMPTRWDQTEKLVRRVEDGGCTVLVWTIDMFAGNHSETVIRYRRSDGGTCSCHTAGFNGDMPAKLTKPILDGILGGSNPPTATWSWVGRLRKLTKMKLVLKGIETGEDARLCRENGADAILVSNHGGRGAETRRASIDSLPEVVDAVGGKVPIMVDSGFRRGTDIYKALALGACMVGIGRPYIYGLSSFGQDGVERVLDILKAELEMVMAQCGTTTIKQITRASIIKAA
jgi:isopentenyl diphosphate isomerase/L-lactate dehydrogenase-like FMN-dependent dehydrogenase